MRGPAAIILLTLFLLAACSEAQVANNTMADEQLAMNDMPTDTNMSMDTNMVLPPENVAQADGNLTNGNQTDGNASSGDDTPYCDVVRQYLPAATCARYREQLARLEGGVRAFRAPDRMEVGQSREVRLAIGRPEDRAEVAQAAGGSTDDPSTRIGTTRIGRIMRATLHGTSFDITPVGNPERILGATSEEVWMWRVTPRDRGQQVLTAELEVLAESGGSGRERLAIYRNNATITVDVSAAQRDTERHQKRMTALQRLKELLTSTEGVLGALAAVLAVIGVIVWRVRRIGKNPAERDGDADGEAPPP